MSLLTTISESLGDIGVAISEHTTLSRTDHNSLREAVTAQLRNLPAQGNAGDPVILDYGDVCIIDPSALSRTINTSREHNECARSHAHTVSEGLNPGPGPSLHAAIRHANAAFPASLRSHLDQWLRMCEDISSFQDATVAADERSARCLAPATGGELR